MEVYEAVHTVLAVRAFQEKPVPANIVAQIIDAGRLTASSMNRQPWQFILVDERDTLQKLGAIARTGPYIAQAALAIVVVVEKTEFAVSDASRAIQSMILTAWSEGVGSNWVGFMGLEGVNNLLGIPPDRAVLAILPMGYPSTVIGKGKKNRKPLAEVAFHGYFGKPFILPSHS